jgi:hypothetical protein
LPGLQELKVVQLSVLAALAGAHQVALVDLRAAIAA